MKQISLVILFLLFLLSLKAQYEYRDGNNEYAIGVKFGNDIYTYQMDSEKNGSFDMLFNYSLGLSGAYYYSSLIEFHASVNYSDRRFAVDWEYPLNDINQLSPKTLTRTEYMMKYINIPIEIRINALKLNWMKLNFGAGVMSDFRFKPAETQYYNNGEVLESEQYWRQKDFTRVLIAFPLSANLKFYLRKHLSMELSAAYYLYINKMQSEFQSKSANAIAPRLAIYYEW